MYLKLFKNDIKNHFFESLSVALFVFLSVALLATAGHLGVQLNISVNDLLLRAQTPHLLQMHKGEIDLERIRSFAEEHPQIEKHQVLEFLNIDNASLAFMGADMDFERSLKDSIYDNGFSVQSPNFDFLLDLNGEKIDAKKGEVYVPLFYKSDLMLEKGDILVIKNTSFDVGHVEETRLKIAGFVRDSQMNSSLSVSKRFIINFEDYQKLARKEFGEMEYLIEFRLKDLNDSAKIEAQYAKQKLESNGPPMIHYKLFQLVNAFSDGITMLTLILISFFVIGISLLCIRFTLLAKLEEDEQELVVLKAIGVPVKKIQVLFLSKYLFLCGIFCILGFLSSYLIKIPLLKNMRDFFGTPKEGFANSSLAFLLSIAVFILLYLAMRKASKRICRLEMTRTNLSDQASSRKKLYITLICVMILSFFILSLPMMISSTMSDKSFVNYLGVGSYDIRIDLSQVKDHPEEIRDLISQVSSDHDILSSAIYLSKWITYRTNSGEQQRIWVEFGEQESFPIRYIEGRAPFEENEISLSKLQAEELSKKVADEITFIWGQKQKVFKISGIYSDLTNGGKTAKVNQKISWEDPDIVWAIIALKLPGKADVNDFMSGYRIRYPFAKISDTESYLKQIFGNTISMIDLTNRLAYFSASALIFVITLLFIKIIYLKEQSENALLKSLGFTTGRIKRKYYLLISLIVATGFILGTLISLSIGDIIASSALSLIGVHGVVFIRNELFSYFIIPCSIWFSAILATMSGIRELKTMNIAFLLKEDVT